MFKSKRFSLFVTFFFVLAILPDMSCGKKVSTCMGIDDEKDSFPVLVEKPGSKIKPDSKIKPAQADAGENEPSRLSTVKEASKEKPWQLTTGANEPGIRKQGRYQLATERIKYDSDFQDKEIRHLTRHIESGEINAIELADAYYRRGTIWYYKRNYKKALADLTVSINKNPLVAETFLLRGGIRAEKGDYEGAIKDYTRSLELGPNDPCAYSLRGNAFFHLGEFDKAEDDFEKAIELGFNLGKANTVLWLYLARENSGKDGREALYEQTRRLDLNVWPGPVVLLYLGEIEPDKLLARARDDDKEVEKGQLCEGYFYVGEYYLLEARADLALNAFILARNTGLVDYVEYIGAEAEIRRLGREHLKRTAKKRSRRVY